MHLTGPVIQQLAVDADILKPVKVCYFPARSEVGHNFGETINF